MKASFQPLGSKPDSKDLENNIDSGIHSCCAFSLKDKTGQPSGPGGLAMVMMD